MSAAAKGNMTLLETTQLRPSAGWFWGCFKRVRRAPQFPITCAGVIGNISLAWFSWDPDSITVFLDKAD